MHYIAEIETHDPVGRQVILYIGVKDDRSIFYEPKLETGEMLSLSSVFPTGEVLPTSVEKGSESTVVDEIESKLRYFYSKVKKIF